jgi:hypothetical protein
MQVEVLQAAVVSSTHICDHQARPAGSADTELQSTAVRPFAESKLLLVTCQVVPSSAERTACNSYYGGSRMRLNGKTFSICNTG